MASARFPFSLLVSVVALLSLVACSSGSDDDDGTKNAAGSGTTCTITNGTTNIYCYKFTPGYPDTKLICDEKADPVKGTVVSACPDGEIVGTCTATFVSGNSTYGYDWVFYASSGFTCERAQQSCAGINGLVSGASSTFVGNGC